MKVVIDIPSTHSRNYLGYLTNGIGAQLIYLHTVEII